MGMFNRKEKDQNKGIHMLKYTFAFFFFFLLCVCDRDRYDVRGRTCSGTSCTILSHWEAVVCCLTGTGTHIPAYRTPRPTASHQWRRNAICGVVHPLQFWLCLLIKKNNCLNHSRRLKDELFLSGHLAPLSAAASPLLMGCYSQQIRVSLCAVPMRQDTPEAQVTDDTCPPAVLLCHPQPLLTSLFTYRCCRPIGQLSA